MLDWRIRIKTQSGSEGFNGKADLAEHLPLIIECELPECTINVVTAETDVVIDDDEKIFMNGYQTWTNCPEYGKHDKIRGLHGIPKFLIDKFSFDRYGDYHFVDYPNKKGVTHGFSARGTNTGFSPPLTRKTATQCSHTTATVAD